ncbi:MAG TPA: methionine adenosyltransferase [Nitrospirota bacterium]|nr:methionine adenosyltransferase [Nitrospirota bacterium]
MIIVEPFPGKPVADHLFEIVERKGVGHPDTLCDSMMDAISIALSQAYLQEFGTILHHNIDKGLLAAGSVRKEFKGGEVLKPMELTIGDRATSSAKGRSIPVAEIAVDAARAWLRKNMRFVDPEQQVNYRVVLAPGSEELTDIFSRPGAVRGANDTSATVGYYPLSPTEQMVLGLERRLNSPDFKASRPETGEDVKVMALRHGNDLDLTVAMPLLCREISSEKDYFWRKDLLIQEMSEFLRQGAGSGEVRVHYNALDEPGRGMDGIYLSLTGTSAEDADSGQVGRGNRVNGLISVNRPLGTEAAAGKNPVSHVGKIYNILSHRLAEKLCREIEGIREAYVYLVSRIGSPIDQPQMAAAQVVLERGLEVRDVSRRAEEIIERELAGIAGFCRELSEGKHPLG